MKALFTVRPNFTNRIIDNLEDGLRPHAEVNRSIEAFWKPDCHYDLIHIHWPKDLIDRDIDYAAQLRELEDQFIFWKARGTCIVFTRHNYLPHYAYPLDRSLYELCFRMADGMIHMGRHSMRQFQETESGYDIQHVFIPHPWYPNVDRRTDGRAEREVLGIDHETVLILVFGQLRQIEEQELACAAFRALEVPGKKMIIASGTYIRRKPAWRKQPLQRINWEFQQWRFEKRLGREGIFYYKRHWDEEEVHQLFGATDLVFLPRQNTLNSGVLPLAFSYGKVVVGPATGNMREILVASGNPTFVPYDVNSMTQALREGISLRLSDLGKHNRKYAEDKWNISDVGEQHATFYRSLLIAKDVNIK